jgi:hypothetical protein
LALRARRAARSRETAWAVAQGNSVW